MKKSINIEKVIMTIGVIAVLFTMGLNVCNIGSNDKSIMETKMEDVKAIDEACTDYLVAYLEANLD